MPENTFQETFQWLSQPILVQIVPQFQKSFIWIFFKFGPICMFSIDKLPIQHGKYATHYVPPVLISAKKKKKKKGELDN